MRNSDENHYLGPVALLLLPRRDELCRQEESMPTHDIDAQKSKSRDDTNTDSGFGSITVQEPRFLSFRT
jgi:hypothetical protein